MVVSFFFRNRNRWMLEPNKHSQNVATSPCHAFFQTKSSLWTNLWYLEKTDSTNPLLAARPQVDDEASRIREAGTSELLNYSSWSRGDYKILDYRLARMNRWVNCCHCTFRFLHWEEHIWRILISVKEHLVHSHHFVFQFMNSWTICLCWA